MRIVFIEIQNYRGIKKLDWAPTAHVNCLIGPGDSTKTTILDAIELVLNPRSYVFADDSDFFDLDVEKPIIITVTLSNLPSGFKSDDRYGMHLRGWNAQDSTVEDEPNENLEDALSVRVKIDRSLEARWSIFNDRIEKEEGDPPTVRYKDAKQIATSRLGAYAERHLGWGRQSVLMQMEEGPDSISLQLAEASRAARETFRKSNQNVFKETVSLVQKLGNKFSVPIRDKYVAELDVQGVSITAGGISLHDGKLPLRRLGTGSSRLLVSALQHDAGDTHIALIDEVEHGLEPHRIARLLNHLKSPATEKEKGPPSQIFMTTHSPVVIRELTANDICTVRSNAGITEVRAVAANAKDLTSAQRHLRSSPEAFFARRILVGEGRTEQGLLRGLDSWWSQQKRDSFSLRGVIAIDGGGIPDALNIAKHLLDLGYEVALLLDTDKTLPESQITSVQKKGGAIFKWQDSCSTEERIFLDVPWQTVIALVNLAVEHVGSDSVRAQINNVCRAKSLSEISEISALPNSLDTDNFRRALGMAAKKDKRPWFKDITRGEQLAEILAPCLVIIPDKPLSETISSLRQWVDA
jgi:putative ATP-dependent endonuclease of the OLD family